MRVHSCREWGREYATQLPPRQKCIMGIDVPKRRQRWLGKLRMPLPCRRCRPPPRPDLSQVPPTSVGRGKSVLLWRFPVAYSAPYDLRGVLRGPVATRHRQLQLRHTTYNIRAAYERAVRSCSARAFCRGRAPSKSSPVLLCAPSSCRQLLPAMWGLPSAESPQGSSRYLLSALDHRSWPLSFDPVSVHRCSVASNCSVA
jgi:hypothetical protein